MTTTLETFESKILRTGHSGCWLWTGCLSTNGYGKVGFERRSELAHRVAYTLYVGPIPEGLTIDHLCRNRVCVNPAHLEPVSNRENILRGTSFSALNARKTHCPKGHPYEGDNLFFDGDARCCRICSRERSRLYQQRRRQLLRVPSSGEARGTDDGSVPASPDSTRLRLVL